MYDALLVT